MKDKNGFTLAETLGVITIITIISWLTISIGMRVLNESRKKINEYDKDIVLDAAKIYATDLENGEKTYKLESSTTIDGKKYNKGDSLENYEFLKYVKDNDITTTTKYLIDEGYVDDKKIGNCSITIKYETTIQDGYIVVDKISAKLGDDCK